MKTAVAPSSVEVALLWMLVWIPSLGSARVQHDYLMSRKLITGGEFVIPNWFDVTLRHPKKATRAALIVDEFFLQRGEGYYIFCVEYSRWRQVNKPNRGMVRATIEVIKSNGEQLTVAELSAEVSDHYASQCSSYFEAPFLDLGDVVLFRFKFKKMPPLNQRSHGASFRGLVESFYPLD